ncbi:hypothetical protein [Plantactinospora sp. CA-290183]|uniref:hypothetical protein n=1 Tax=Plantactinospora sp. CA-290183 TaxID=3240006 RepID=UPI003D944CC2
MLSTIQREAIHNVLFTIDMQATNSHPWPGPVVFGWLKDSPERGHPDPTARRLELVPLRLEPAQWQKFPEGPVGGLRQITEEAHHPIHQARSSANAGRTDHRALAYLFMYPQHIDHESFGRIPVRFIDAIDTDGTCYTLTHLPTEPHALLTRVDDTGGQEFFTLLRRLMDLSYPDPTQRP